MDNSKKKQIATDQRDVAGNAERRRIGRIVHDDRGNARVDWHDAPSDHQRPVFELEGARQGPLAIQTAPRTFDPYARTRLPEPNKEAAPRKDLRKLSEWIKLMRDLEARKRKGEAE
ncbi:MAG: hypothetical protein ACRETD_00140 [Steroidobacteraceae bacterium]